jgi:D-3-phosphoglycerate dehydrogenase
VLFPTPSTCRRSAPRSAAAKPFVKLAEVLGAFVGQVTEDPIKEVEILFDSSTATMNTRADQCHPGRPDPAAGLRRQHGVGADHGEKERGIIVAEVKSATSRVCSTATSS